MALDTTAMDWDTMARGPLMLMPSLLNLLLLGILPGLFITFHLVVFPFPVVFLPLPLFIGRIHGDCPGPSDGDGSWTGQPVALPSPGPVLCVRLLILPWIENCSLHFLSDGHYGLDESLVV